MDYSSAMAKTIRYAIAAIVLIAVLGACISRCNKYQHEASTLHDQLKASRDSTHYWVNKLGQPVQTRATVTGTTDQVGRFYDLDSAARAFDIKASQLLASVRAAVSGHTTLAPAAPATSGQDAAAQLRYLDSLARGLHPCPPPPAWMRQQFTNQYFAVDARVGEGSFASVKWNDRVQVTHFKTRQGSIFSRRYYDSIGIKSDNPDARYDVQEAFRIVPAAPPKNYPVLKVGVWYPFLLLPRQLHGEVEGGYQWGRLGAFLRYERQVTGTPLPQSKDFLQGGVRVTILDH